MTDAVRQTPPWETIPAMLRDAARRDPDGAAIVTDDARVTYAALATEVTSAARALIHAGVQIARYRDFPSLCAALVSMSPPRAVVTGLRDSRNRSCVPDVGRLCSRHPAVPVVSYDAPAPAIASDIVRAARAGVAASALHGADDLAGVLGRAVATTGCRRVADRALALVDGRLDHTPRPILEFCLVHAASDPSVEAVAAAVGVSRKTVAARLAAAGLPPAGTLVCWGRVLLAAWWLQHDGRAVERVAHALGFADGTGLHHLLVRYTGRSPRQVREAGGLGAVLPQFAAAVDVGAVRAGPGDWPSLAGCLTLGTTSSWGSVVPARAD